MKPFLATNPQKPLFNPSPSSSSMAVTAGLTFRASSLLRHRFSFPHAPSRFANLAGLISDARFLSTARPYRSSRSPRSLSVKPLQARRRDDSSGSDVEEGGVRVNGSAVVVKEKGLAVTEGRIVKTELHKEATEAYMAYAMSVLLGRALPDVRDGLKPVHRRILNARGLSGPWLLFVSESGYGKRVPVSLFRLSPRNRVGLIGYKFSSEDKLAAVFVVGFSSAEDGESDEQVVLVSQSGTVNRIKVRDVSIQSRYARGVILMRLEHAGKIQSASLISATETDLDENEASPDLQSDQAVSQ